MQLSQLLVQELDKEAASTRKLLQYMPDEHANWQPHTKSFSLAKMANHVAELPMFLKWILTTDELDMTTLGAARTSHSTREEILKSFEEKYAEGRALLEKATNEQLMERWVFKFGDRIILDDTRYNCIRGMMLNHHIHHRGQLSVYLRMLDVPYSGLYGPSADDNIAREKAMAAASN